MPFAIAPDAATRCSIHSSVQAPPSCRLSALAGAAMALSWIRSMSTPQSGAGTIYKTRRDLTATGQTFTEIAEMRRAGGSND